jgi:small subunit ribosomal protein S17
MTEQQTTATKQPRTLVGRVDSARMDKTVIVVIERMERHPFYGKFLRRSSRFFAHDEANECRRGDMVAITPCRPLSKRKAWRVSGIVERADTRFSADEENAENGTGNKEGGVGEVRA